ncbi:PREDICTED: ceramide kinase-like [Nanorana parkeri]|uniref:ceramide kinase-like n=1 Tax=Nanorana parkeri TaxID=125878 RepID=UPI00085461B0|nr:PREDICTED: ceramide kinase-like [Nanorana parkeri]
MERENIMCLLRLQGAEVSVTLEQDTLNWAYSKKRTWRRKSQSVSVPVDEMVTVQQGDSKQQTKTIDAPSNLFTVYYVLRKSCKRWSLQMVTFTAPDAQVAHDWVQRIQEKIQKTGQSRPRKLLVFINPYGGRGKASRIYYTKISPLFQLAGIESDVIETTRANHARDYIMDSDLQKYDGVVCVGGDGMFSELLHGLVKRTQSDSGISEDQEDARLTPCSLRIGIIPAGSTDCVCFATMGINDPVTSALHIIIGDTQPMDVCASYHDGELMRYSVSLIGYGFFGDVLRESENMRWVGPLRYDLAGIRMVLSNRSYRGTVEFLEANDNNSSPRDNTRCRTGCLVCSESSDRLSAISESKKLVENLDDVSQLEDWKSVTGSFAALNITGMSSACPKSQDGLSPTAHLADGTADLIMVQKCSILQFIKHLSRHTNGKDQFALPNVKVHRIHALRFTPEQLDDDEVIRRQKRPFVCPCGEDSVNSTWNCDGEILDCAQLSIRVHHQLIQLFARGIEDMPCRYSSSLPPP